MRTSVDDIKPWEQGGFREVDVEYDVRGPDLEKLQAIIAQLRAQVKHYPGRLDIDSTYEGGLPELQVHIDRQKAADLGVSVSRHRGDDAHDGAGRHRDTFPRRSGHLRRAPPARREISATTPR